MVTDGYGRPVYPEKSFFKTSESIKAVLSICCPFKLKKRKYRTLRKFNRWNKENTAVNHVGFRACLKYPEYTMRHTREFLIKF